MADLTKKDLSESDKHYFDSYDHFGIHEEMLKDQVRTLSYRNAMFKNKHLFKDKVVLDVGCGTGILSMFAARSGAKHVIAVDMSNIIDMAKKIVDLNGLSDKITLVRGKMEEVTLPYPKVDIIISEWMGYFLLYESMLDSVLYARDKYLVEDGLILPNHLTMHMAAIEDGSYKAEKVYFWEDVYGFDYSPFIPLAMSEPLVDTVEYKSVISTSHKIFDLDLYTIKVEDLAFSSDFSIKMTRDDIVHGFVAWFDTDFEPVPRNPSDKRTCTKVKFSTGPHAPYTHWKQTIFYTEHDIDVRQNDVLNGTITSKPRSDNPRHLDVKISWNAQKKYPGDASQSTKGSFTYAMR